MRNEKTGTSQQLRLALLPIWLSLTDLKSKRKPPAYAPGRKGESQRQPIAQSKASNAICHLYYDQFPTTSHLAGLALPYTCGRSVHARSQSSDYSPHVHHGGIVGSSLDDSSESDGEATKDQGARTAELVARVDGGQGTCETTQVVDRGHGTLLAYGWVADGFEEVLLDKDISKYSLIVPDS